MAPFSVYCPHCKQVLTTDSVYSGQVVACPLCHNNFTVPTMPAPAVQAAPPPPPPPQPPLTQPRPLPAPAPGPLDVPPWEQQYPQSHPAPPQPQAPPAPGSPQVPGYQMPQSQGLPGYPSIPGYQMPPGYQTPYPSAWNPPQAPEFAGFWRRFVAIFIDGLILLAILCGAAFPLVLLSGDLNTVQATGKLPPGLETVLNLFSLILYWLYFTLSESSSSQATLGKRAMGIVVTDLQGNRISFGRANGRYWSKILSWLTCTIGFIMAGFTEKKQALHDMIAGTLVMKR